LPGLWREAGLVLLSYVASAAALCWTFPEPSFWPLAFVCLVPWAVATCRTHRAWLAHWLSFFVGWGFFLVALRWLMPVTGLGYAALALYLAFYWPLAAWAIRTGRRHGISPLWTLPVVWVACEYLRATVMTGFPWLFLAHGLYRQLPLIQISDLGGAYGVSFLVALVNGVIVEGLLLRFAPPGARSGPGQFRVGLVVTAVLLVSTLAYGWYRLAQVDYERDPGTHGPRVAVIQHDFPLSSRPPYGDHPYVVLASYLSLAAEAAGQRPDLLALPETVWSAYQNIDFLEKREQVPEVRPGSWDWGMLAHRAVSGFARGDYSAVNAVIGELEQRLRELAAARRDSNLPDSLPRLPAVGGPPVTTLVGAVSIEQSPEATYPKVKYYNSALVYDQDGTQRPSRYDKNHLVPFGEFVPFRQARFLGFDLHWLYRRLNALSPFSHGGQLEYSLTPGSELTVFELPTGRGTYRFGTPICYEDATPRVIRRFVWDGWRRRVDFLLNISNDAWFLYSDELPQHLAICVFRAVENRVTIARAVNTGISGFIDPDGRIYAVVQKDGRRVGPGVVGYQLQPVYLDQRASLYGRFGDWLPQLCLAAAGLLWAGAVLERWVWRAKRRIATWLGKAAALVALAVPLSGCAGNPTTVQLTPQERLELENRAINLLLLAAESDLDDVSCNAIEALVKVAPRDGLSAFRKAVRSSAAIVRYAGLVALGEVRDRESLRLMTAAVNDASQHVRLAAAFAASRCGKDGYVRILIRALTDASDEAIRAEAAMLLGRLQEPRAKKWLQAAVRLPANDQSKRVRLAISGALAALGDEGGLRELINYSQGDPAARTDALLMLAELGHPEGRDALRYRLQGASEEYDEARLIAARGLGRLGYRDGFDLAMKLLRYTDPNPNPTPENPSRTFAVRSLAIHALAEIGDLRALPALREVAASQDDPRLQVAACYAICRLISKSPA